MGQGVLSVTMEAGMPALIVAVVVSILVFCLPGGAVFLTVYWGKRLRGFLNKRKGIVCIESSDKIPMDMDRAKAMLVLAVAAVFVGVLDVRDRLSNVRQKRWQVPQIGRPRRPQTHQRRMPPHLNGAKRVP